MTSPTKAAITNHPIPPPDLAGRVNPKAGIRQQSVMIDLN
jgi:hypothetical protein